MKKIIDILRYKFRSRWTQYFHKKKQQRIKRMILNHYEQHPPKEPEIREAVSYLSKNMLTTFYGTFQEKQDPNQIEVFTDKITGLRYVLTEGKKLYFKRSLNKHTIQLLFHALCVEQDSEGPHCYTDADFQIKEGDILADIGSAEGYFSLLHIEKLKHSYLFEQDKEWQEALEATFAAWKEKVTIIPYYVSDGNDNENVSLDQYFLPIEEKPNFYKIDVEGAEASVLKGMDNLLEVKPMKIALCTYHHQDDFEIFSHYFKEKGFRYRPNRGVMIYQNDLDHMTPPYFRTCLIKATNQYE